MKKRKTWVEIDKDALIHNAKTLKNLMNEGVFGVAVKANAYGHGLVEASRCFLEGGADFLCVDALFEALILREAEIKTPIYIMGYILLDELKIAVKNGFSFVVYNPETVEKLGEIGEKAKIHLKIETGNNRQGILISDLPGFIEILKKYPFIEVEGVATHFANIEDTTDHTYAEKQFSRFIEAIKLLEKNGINPRFKHCANSAATILFPHTHFNFVRTGIAAYGMWPSSETYVSAVKAGKNNIELRPAMTWKTIIAQIKDISAGEFIGYGCTCKTTCPTRLAILPIGYYDGYDRKLSNNAFVLINGRRAPVKGRVCMNMVMVDITHIPEARIEDEVVLLGYQGDEKISAEMMGDWIGTINYEVTTRINERIPREIRN